MSKSRNKKASRDNTETFLASHKYNSVNYSKFFLEKKSKQSDNRIKL